MKIKLMKLMNLNFKNKTLMSLSLASLAMLVVASVAADVLNYIDVVQVEARSFRDLQFTEKLAQAMQLNAVVCDLKTGQSEDSVKLLKWQLAQDIKVINALAPSANETKQILARRVVGQVQHTEASHPNLYLAAAPLKCTGEQ